MLLSEARNCGFYIASSGATLSGWELRNMENRKKINQIKCFFFLPLGLTVIER